MVDSFIEYAVYISAAMYLGNARGSESSSKVGPGAQVGTQHLQDARAKNALHLQVALIPVHLGLQFSSCRLSSNFFHWTDKCSTSYEVPQLLGLKLVPHLLFPDLKV